MKEVEKDRSKSLWQDMHVPFPELKKNITTEVCIVGGGIAGISTAYQLAKRGHKVVVLEGARVGSGQTGRTTAHLTYQVEEQLADMIKHHDVKRLTEFANSHKKAIDVVEDIIFQENISCDFKRMDGFLFLGPDDEEKLLDEEVRIGRELGLDLSKVKTVEGFANLGPAVLYPDQAQFNPMKYINGLIRVMRELDVDVYEGSHVKEFVYEGQKHHMTTDDGFTVEAEYLVVATDSPVNNRFYMHTKQSPYRSYVVGFEMKERVDVPLLWDTDEPYRYIRKSGDLLLIGGEDHRTGQNPEKDPYEQLINWGRENFSFLGDVKWKWSGQVFEPVDGMAFIGKNPGLEKNVFIVTGQSGIGMTSGTIASLIIPDLIENRSNSMIEIFDPSRSSIRDTTEFLKDNSNVALQYKDWLTPSEVKSEADIPIDQGGLIREGLTKTCVYRADSDEVEKRCAICPHLGGIVHWNDLEKTWDCPCHGSRFNAHGTVIEGPSLSSLLER